MRTLFSSLILLVACLSCEVNAFPIMVKKGYPFCTSCHVSPTGGGVLTPYGRGSSEEMLSTWSYENEGSESHGALEYLTGQRDDTGELNFGANIRSARVQTDKGRRYINMQKEFEMSLALDDRLTLVGTVGEYARGPESVKEYRRRYVLYESNENVSIRVGKFIPAYGLNVDDHTLGVRSALGYGEGSESNNLEGTLRFSSSEIVVTSGVSKNSQFSENHDGRYQLQTEEKFVALRTSYSFVSKSLIGLSFQVKQDDRIPNAPVKTQFGFFGVSGILSTPFYLMADNNWKALNDSGPIQWQPYLYDLVGAEFVQGVHLQLYYERKNLLDEYGAKLQWFPRPHWDLSTTYEYSKLGYAAIFMVHYYL